MFSLKQRSFDQNSLLRRKNASRTNHHRSMPQNLPYGHTGKFKFNAQSRRQIHTYTGSSNRRLQNFFFWKNYKRNKFNISSLTYNNLPHKHDLFFYKNKVGMSNHQLAAGTGLIKNPKLLRRAIDNIEVFSNRKLWFMGKFLPTVEYSIPQKFNKGVMGKQPRYYPSETIISSMYGGLRTHSTPQRLTYPNPVLIALGGYYATTVGIINYPHKKKYKRIQAFKSGQTPSYVQISKVYNRSADFIKKFLQKKFLTQQYNLNYTYKSKPVIVFTQSNSLKILLKPDKLATSCGRLRHPNNSLNTRLLSALVNEINRPHPPLLTLMRVSQNLPIKYLLMPNISNYFLEKLTKNLTKITLTNIYSPKRIGLCNMNFLMKNMSITPTPQTVFIPVYNLKTQNPALQLVNLPKITNSLSSWASANVSMYNTYQRYLNVTLILTPLPITRLYNPWTVTFVDNSNKEVYSNLIKYGGTNSNLGSPNKKFLPLFVQKLHTLQTSIFFKFLNKNHLRYNIQLGNVNWRRSPSHNKNTVHAKNSTLTYYLNNYVVSNFTLLTMRLTRLLTTKTATNMDKPKLLSNVSGKYPPFLKKLFYTTLVPKIFKKKKLLTLTSAAFYRAFFFRKKNSISTLIDPALPTKSLNLLNNKYSTGVISSIDPKLPRTSFTSPVLKLIKSPLPNAYTSLKKKSTLITHNSVKKNLRNRLSGQLTVLKFFTKYIPNNLRNFQNFSKLYSRRKLLLKNLRSSSSMVRKQLLITNIALNFSTPPNLQKLPTTPRPLLKAFFLKKIPSAYSLAWIISNPLLFKMCVDTNNSTYTSLQYIYTRANLSLTNKEFLPSYNSEMANSGQPYLTNLHPHNKFTFVIFKKIYAFFANNKIHKNIIPLYYHTLIRFIENCSGKKALLQFYPFVNQCIEKDFIVRYKIWLPRLNFYERRLGHKFFLEEAIHIIHLSFILRDPKLLLSWLSAIIQRISFWKTRSIFRFIKYLMLNFFIQMFPKLNMRGVKITLRGKISAAGNSRKRAILYRAGETSHSKVSLRVLSEFGVITTFTGVLGFRISIFY